MIGSRKKAFIWIILLCLLFPGITAAAKSAEPGFTEQEMEVIRTYGTLKVGYVADRLPVSFCDEKTGEFAGISRQIFDRIQEISGLKFEYAALPGGSVTYDILRAGHFDLVSSVEYNDANKHSRGILISNPYLKSKKVIVGRPDIVFEKGERLRVALSTGSQTLKGVLGGQYPNFEFVDYDSIGQCFEAVWDGEADLLLQNQYVVEYWRARAKYQKLVVIPISDLDDMLCFSAVTPIGADSADEQKELEQKQVIISILDKSIACMSQDEVTTYVISSTMENQYNFGLNDFLYRYRYQMVVLGIVFLVIICLICVSIFFYSKTVKAQAQAKVKDDFLSAMSHEILTPINGMLGLNQLMLHHLDDTEKVQECLEQSSMTAKYLLTLVSDIFDMSKLQENGLAIEHAMFSLARTVQSVEFIEQERMSEKGLQFEVDAQFLHPYLIGDETRVQQILRNLTDNAYKFTPPGGKVTVKVRQEQIKDGWVSSRISVEDTGCGMSEAFRKKIFDSFTRESHDVSKGNQGMGLGMAICHELAKLMNGELLVESEPDRGSCFTFVFPAQMAQEIPEQQPIEEKKGRILVAEDNELNADIIKELLQDAGYPVDVAKNGQEAVELFKNSEEGYYPFILMDLLMPVKDGYQAAREIRKMSRPDAETVKIIACTANVLKEDRSRAIASGMDSFIAKPIDMRRLLGVLSAAEPAR